LDKSSCYYRSLSPARLRAPNTAATTAPGAGESMGTASVTPSAGACPTAANQLGVNTNWLKVPQPQHYRLTNC